MTADRLSLQEMAIIASGAAVGAVFASTGRIVPHPMTAKPWPYMLVLAAGLGLIAFEQTRLFGMGMGAYGLAKTFLKTLSQQEG